MTAAILAVTFEFLENQDFWINVGVLATTYGVFALGVQLNIGTTGIFNFGQAGFMAVGSYTMGILVVKSGVSFWLALLAGLGTAAAAAILVGLPSLRLRADYFAISTLAFSEIVRYIADNWDGLTGGNLGLFGYTDTWNDLSTRIDGWLGHLGIAPHFLLPLLVVNLAVFLVLAAFVAVLVHSPWGRVLNAIREDEDAARALGKNTFAYKLQSLSIAGARTVGSTPPFGARRFKRAPATLNGGGSPVSVTTTPVIVLPVRATSSRLSRSPDTSSSRLAVPPPPALLRIR